MLIIYLGFIKKIEKSKNNFIDNLRSMSSSISHNVDNLSEINKKKKKNQKINLLIALDQCHRY